jgi:hypothetical protein
MHGGRIIALMPFNRVENVLYSWPGSCDGKIDEAEGKSLTLEEMDEQMAVFSSHFFENPRRSNIEEFLRSNQKPYCVQVSPGAEISELYEDISSLDPDLAGVDVVMDRCPYDEDLRLIGSLADKGFLIRWIFVPKKEIDSLRELEKLPVSLRQSMYLYFPPANRMSGSFLSDEEVFLFQRKLEVSYPELASRILSYDWGGDYKGQSPVSTLTAESYRKRFFAFSLSWFARAPVLLIFAVFDLIRGGSTRAYQRACSGADRAYWRSRNRWTQIYWTLFFVGSQTAGFFRAQGTHLYWGVRSRCSQAYWQTRTFFTQAYWAIRGRGFGAVYFLVSQLLGFGWACMVRSYWWLRARSSRLYWSIRGSGFGLIYSSYSRLSGCFRSLVVRGFWWIRSISSRVFWRGRYLVSECRWRTRVFFGSPFYFIRVYIPPVYWVLCFPVLKLFWFLRFQLSKRFGL